MQQPAAGRRERESEDSSDISACEDVEAAKSDKPLAAFAGAPGRSTSRTLYTCALAFSCCCVLMGLGVGLWALRPRPRDHIPNVFTVSSSSTIKRTYFIAADYVTWDYGERGNACYQGSAEFDDMYANLTSTLPMTATLPEELPGGRFLKAQYREYTSADFTTLKQRPASQEHLGLLGPLIYAEAGDSIQVVLRNNLPFAVNLEPAGGVSWTPNSITSNSQLPPVPPGDTGVVVWTIPLDALVCNHKCNASDGYQNSRLMLYRSSVAPTAHDNLGLLGPIIITAQGEANPDGTTKGVDRDFVNLYQVISENSSSIAFINNGNFANLNASGTEKNVINGYVWCNIPGMTMNLGEKVRWHVASMGSAESGHNVHWHGNTLLNDGHRVDHVALLGSNTATLDMSVKNPGVWLNHCHVNMHADGGMVLVYTVLNPNNESYSNSSAVPAPGGVERVYFIAADEVIWDYAPTGGVNCSGTVEPFEGTDAEAFLGEPEGLRIGSKFLKSLFRQYTDGNFTTLLPRSEADAYMGYVGPTIRAQVGDVIKVVFRNNGRYPSSVHPHGVMYGKESEGAFYSDGTSAAEQLDGAVFNGSTCTYVWEVPEHSGPGPADPSSLIWLYHSHTSETHDTYAGLFGGIIITRAGAAGNITSAATIPQPLDVDQEVVLYYTVLDEWASNYVVDNIKQYLNSSLWTDPLALEDMLTGDSEPAFHEAERHHAINGFMYCNLPNLKFTAGQRIRMHIMVLGTFEDLHSPHISGGTFLTLGGHGSAVVTLAGSMLSSDVMFTQPGTWDLNCRVVDHVLAGMDALYDVAPAPSGPLMAAAGTPVRRYYIAAEEVAWNYAPSGFNPTCVNPNLLVSSFAYLTASPNSLGAKFEKALFRQYTDNTYTKLVDRPAYMGLLGPLITAEVGDIIVVALKNRLDFPVAFTPDGGLVAVGNLTEGLSVEPGASFTYTWVVPMEAGPMEGDMSVQPLTYLSGVNYAEHTSAGLLGLILIAAKGGFKADGATPTDVDQVVPLLFQAHNEGGSPLFMASIKAGGIPDNEAVAFSEIAGINRNSMMFAINGRIYCNLQVPLKAGSRVRFVLVGFGSEEGLHSPRITGHVAQAESGTLQSQQVIPAVTRMMDMTMRAGVWPILCDIELHLQRGMIAQAVVT